MTRSSGTPCFVVSINPAARCEPWLRRTQLRHCLTSTGGYTRTSPPQNGSNRSSIARGTTMLPWLGPSPRSELSTGTSVLVTLAPLAPSRCSVLHPRPRRCTRLPPTRWLEMAHCHPRRRCNGACRWTMLATAPVPCAPTSGPYICTLRCKARTPTVTFRTRVSRVGGVRFCVLWTTASALQWQDRMEPCSTILTTT